MYFYNVQLLLLYLNVRVSTVNEINKNATRLLNCVLCVQYNTLCHYMYISKILGDSEEARLDIRAMKARRSKRNVGYRVVFFSLKRYSISCCLFVNPGL